MNRKKHIIWLSSFILLLTFFALPGESSAKTVSKKVTINNIKLEGTINIYNDRASATTSASNSNSVSMTVTSSFMYGISGQTIGKERVVSSSHSGHSGASSGIVTTAKSNVYGTIPIRAEGKHSWSFPSNYWTETTNVRY